MERPVIVVERLRDARGRITGLREAVPPPWFVGPHIPWKNVICWGYGWPQLIAAYGVPVRLSLEAPGYTAIPSWVLDLLAVMPNESDRVYGMVRADALAWCAAVGAGVLERVSAAIAAYRLSGELGVSDLVGGGSRV